MDVSEAPRDDTAVFDCVIFVQAVLSPRGPAARCLEAVENGRVRLLISEEILAEVRQVLVRPAVQRKRRHLTPAFVNAYLERVGRLTSFVDPVPRHVSLERDPKDQPYLDLAIAEQVTFLVSRDLDLLDLSKPGSAVGEELRRLHPGLSILDPVAFLDIVLPREEAT